MIRPRSSPISWLASALVVSAATFPASFAQQPAPEAAANLSGGPMKGARYVIDPTHTFVIYEIVHYGISTNRGRISTRDGSVQIDADATGGKIDITMDIASISTGVELLNRHLESKDFFNVAEFPTARFVADRFVLAEGKAQQIQGSLELLGRTQPVTLKATRFGCYVAPMLRRQVCGGDFETTVDRSRWGLTWGLAFGFEDRVRLMVQVEAIHVP